MQFRPIAIALIINFSFVVAHADPPAGSTWTPIPELTDDFKGSQLDSTKWWNTNPTWQGRPPGYFSPANVSVDDSGLHLTARAEAPPTGLPPVYHTFTTAAVKSKARALYGYFEIKARAMNSSVSSAFWFYAQDPSVAKPTLWTEIDIFEVCGKSQKEEQNYHTNAHVMVAPEIGKKQVHSPGVWKASFRFSDDFHVYGLEWSADSLKWYVDGACIRDLPNAHWHQALNMNFDSETMPNWFGLPNPKDLPSTFTIAYVHSWKKSQ